MRKIAGLSLSFVPPFFVGSLVLWVVLSVIGLWLLELPLIQAILGGLLATLLYWVSDIVHQLGHAAAAHRTGYPMVGIRLGTHFVLGTALYPDDEEPLGADIHIRRALGGPTASLIFTILTGIIALWLYPSGGVAWWMALYLCLTNLMVFTIGAFIPLGFTDGSTILEWRGKK